MYQNISKDALNARWILCLITQTVLQPSNVFVTLLVTTEFSIREVEPPGQETVDVSSYEVIQKSPSFKGNQDQLSILISLSHDDNNYKETLETLPKLYQFGHCHLDPVGIVSPNLLACDLAAFYGFRYDVRQLSRDRCYKEDLRQSDRAIWYYLCVLYALCCYARMLLY
ncbi:LAMI_0G12992g1_1 [Lachancea mirantina]|uniref:LAMI_0G12992g1_1 n=1 Tax=Lachancea mirantina TaxID=1230905 RepID=A0A1G4KBK7_9SACH|nr:LAMI_0G12992g1_1 [Lachancea mirantina]